MSRFFADQYKDLTPYVPGEQPQDKKYIKLNTNESPFEPPESVKNAVSGQADTARLYSDPDLTALRAQMAQNYGIPADNIVMSNGSDEILNLAFMAFADEKKPLAFADITYGFYKVIAELNSIPYTVIPLKEDFSIRADDYVGLGKTIVIANPNAPTGLYLELSKIERILKSNPENVVIVDEAYIDFGGESAVCLVKKYDNLIVTGTFSKSRSLAGARLGFAFANQKLIADINALRYSMNPYNVNCFTSAAGIAALKEKSYFDNNCKVIIENRDFLEAELKSLGFIVIPSSANFVFAKTSLIGGKELYLRLKEKGILIRHFDNDRIKDYNRITVGTAKQMKTLIEKIKEVLEEIENEKC
ncbi:MAG: histidinol-phosphate transaminase [Clostridia bacterium]|nr:histidinol-phosphate transaminase [Clostridia bacterium]